METQYVALFEVEIFHNYYQSKLCAELSVEPTPSCNKQMINYGLLFRKTSHGFAVNYNKSSLEKDKDGKFAPLIPVTDNIQLSFVLRSKNPFLVNYSDLPLDKKRNQIYCLNNLNENINGETKQLLITSGTYMSGNDRLTLKPQVFQGIFESINATDKVKIVDGYNNTLLEKTVNEIPFTGRSDRTVLNKTVQFEKNTLNYRVDLRPHPPGTFTLSINDEEKMKFYASDELNSNDVFGVIDLYKNDKVPLSYQYSVINKNIENSIMKKNNYVIRIDNRQTYWKYNVVLKYRLEKIEQEEWREDWLDRWPGDAPQGWPVDWPQDWSIVCTRDSSALPITLQSKKEDSQALSDGTISFPFVADKLLPLQQKPIKSVELKKTGNSMGTLSGIKDIEKLPYPSYRNLKQDSEDNSKFYSEIFIYL